MRVIYADDEKPALDNFRLTVADFTEIDSLELFQNGDDAVEWMKKHAADVAFLDMEMPGGNGITLAKRLKAVNENLRVVFVTAYSQFALDAFGVDAIGYILKPYTKQEVHKELRKAAMIRPLPSKRVVIDTMPNFVVSVDGNVLTLGRTKPEELLALLVDRAEAGVTVGEAIACLWPERTNDENTQSLYRVTLKRLMDALKEAGIDDIIVSEGRKKYIRMDQVECDFYRILSGDADAVKRYAGEYLREYSWAEVRNAQLNSLKKQ